jgi:hypothetical protein
MQQIKKIFGSGKTFQTRCTHFRYEIKTSVLQKSCINTTILHSLQQSETGPHMTLPPIRSPSTHRLGLSQHPLGLERTRRRRRTLRSPIRTLPLHRIHHLLAERLVPGQQPVRHDLSPTKKKLLISCRTTLPTHLNCDICIGLKIVLLPLVRARSANNCEYLGSSCIPFSSMESIALCRALRFSCPCGPGWPGCPPGPGGPGGGPCGPGDDDGFCEQTWVFLLPEFPNCGRAACSL